MHPAFSVLLLLCLIVCCLGDRFYCYAGSNLYQTTSEDCTTKDPSYNGTWYCSTIKVCEPYINKNRICIITRGCATEEECATSSGTYSGAALTVNGIKPAGMSIYPSCCLTSSTPSDDATQVDYNEICNKNGASRTYSAYIGAFVAISSVVLSFVFVL